MVYIGDRLKELRVQKFLTQRELAQAASLSPTTIFKIENNQVEPHISTMRKLAEALEIDPKELLRG